MSEKYSHIVRRLPSLHALQVFEVAARHQSFVHAAAELYVTHGAISRQIRQLEEELGLALFERRNRAVFLTNAGKKLYVVCHDVMAELRGVIGDLVAPSPLGPLVISCEPTIAMRWLIPRLALFREKNPEFPVHLLAAGGPIDFARDRVDLALRRSDFKWPETYHMERIASEWMGPVCIPTLTSALTSPAPPRSLQELHARTRPHAWTLWRRQSNISLQLSDTQHFEHFYLSLQAAQAGLGVAMGSIYMVAEDIAAGRLHAPFGFVADQSEYVLLSPVPFSTDERRFRFSEWVRYEMQKTCHLLPLSISP
jgi:DNA-binding transcriptional LysR family regulator